MVCIYARVCFSIKVGSVAPRMQNISLHSACSTSLCRFPLVHFDCSLVHFSFGRNRSVFLAHREQVCLVVGETT